MCYFFGQSPRFPKRWKPLDEYLMVLDQVYELLIKPDMHQGYKDKACDTDAIICHMQQS